MIFDNALNMIGNTPIIRLETEEDSAEVYVKLEGRNLCGSVKDRIATWIIHDMIVSGQLKPGGKIICPSSGNTGIAVAMVAKKTGLKATIVMPESMSQERRLIIDAYGGELILTDKRLGMKGSVDKALEMTSMGYVYFDQFGDPSNPLAHYYTTAKEILDDFDGLDAFVAGVGTGGTITGVGRRLKEAFKDTIVVAVEPESSAVLSGEAPGAHKIQGIGPGFVPDNYDSTIVDYIIKVSDEAALSMQKALSRNYSLFLGISAGANIIAAKAVAQKLERGKKVLTVAADNGEKYLSMLVEVSK